MFFAMPRGEIPKLFVEAQPESLPARTPCLEEFLLEPDDLHAKSLEESRSVVIPLIPQDSTVARAI